MGEVRTIPYNKEDFREYSLTLRILINNYQNDFLEEKTNLIQKDKEIRILIKKNKLDVIDLEELNSFCKNEWKELILKAINEIKKEINLRKTRGMRFSDILFQLDKIEEDLVDISDYSLEAFENIYDLDIKHLRMDARERISNEGSIDEERKIDRKKNYICNIIIATVFFLLGLYFCGL